MQVIPIDQISTFPSYSPSSMAKITSGAILKKITKNKEGITFTMLTSYSSGRQGCEAANGHLTAVAT